MEPGNSNVENPTSLLTLTLFGAFQIRLRDGTPLPSLRTRKGYYLLALLVLRAGREVERNWLAATLWPDSEEGKCRENLNRTLTNLLAALGDDATCIAKPTWHTLRFDLSAGVWTDVAAFDAAMARGDTASLETAVALYNGSLLEGCDEAWIVPERDLREQAFLTALETLAQQALTHANAAEAVRHLRRVVATDPLREKAQRALMKAFAQEGNFASVMQVYRDLRGYLRREMNVEPAPETQALYQQLRKQAHDSSLAKRPPSPEAAASPPVVLPHPLTRFIGREEEIALCTASLHAERLVTLTGAGGVGKTRLAIEVARRCSEEYPEGVWFVDLAPLSDPLLVPQTVAKTLTIREEAESSLIETLMAALRSRRLLLILDNCEHLLEDCAVLAARLLDACPHLRLLATSRQALGIGGEVALPVSSLTAPDPEILRHEQQRLLSGLMEFEAVRLFVERAALVSSAFRLTAGNASAVAQLCRRLDGIPLALELAAARIKTLSVEQIADRLDDRFRLLTGGSRTALPRQQTLQAAMDWSYDLLSEQERVLFRRLSVFAGGWTLEAAETVCAGVGCRVSGVVLSSCEDVTARGRVASASSDISPTPDTRHPTPEAVLDLLAALVDKSLVMVTEENGEERRYWLLETARQYGRERLREAEEEETLRGRHRDCFLDLAEEAEPHLKGAEQATWLSRLEREHDNLRAALAWSVEPEAQLRLASALFSFWSVRCYYAEGRGWLAGALERGKDVSPEVRAKALGEAGILAATQGDFTAGRVYLEEFVAIRRQSGHKSSLARALNNLGWMLINQGDYTAARPVLEESLALKREQQEDPRGIAHSLGHLGVISRLQGDYSQARMLHLESLAISRQVGHTQSIAWALLCLGSVAHLENDTTEAYTRLTESLRIYAELGDKSGVAECLASLAEVESTCQQMERAARLFGAAEALCQALALHLSPHEREIFQRGTVVTRTALGEEAFRNAWQAGRELTAEQAVVYALDQRETL